MQISIFVFGIFVLLFLGRYTFGRPLITVASNSDDRDDSWEIDRSDAIKDIDRQLSLEEEVAHSDSRQQRVRHLDSAAIVANDHEPIRFYSSFQDQIAYSGLSKSLAFNDMLIFEIATQHGTAPDVENVPVNCWLSPYATRDEGGLDDIRETVFLKDGCPEYGNVVVSHPLPTLRNVGVRVGFTLGTFYREEKKFLYVHCEYLKCSNKSIRLDGDEQLPRCPWPYGCAYNTKVSYNESQLMTATSDVILVTSRNQPQEIDVPSASHSDPGDVENCHQKRAHSGEKIVADDSQVKFTWPVVLCASLGSFMLGAILGGSICYWECRHEKKTSRMLQMRLDKETSVGGLALSSVRSKSDSLIEPSPQPDVLAQTPESKRAYNCRLAPKPHRQRHMSGHDGYAPEKAPDSFHPTLSTVVGESTIIRNDESWYCKDVLRDSMD